MKLFYTPGACSLVVRIILNELNIDFQDELVDLRAKKTASGVDYRTLNPKGAVPAIQLDKGEILTENQVILQYLADNCSRQNLLAPVKELKRYRTLEWLNYISTELHKTFGVFFNPTLADEVKNKTFLPVIMAKFAYINEHLAKRSYLMGEELTLPDAYLFVMLRWAHHFKIDLSENNHLNQFMQRMLAREAVKKSLEQEGLA